MTSLRILAVPALAALIAYPAAGCAPVEATDDRHGHEPAEVVAESTAALSSTDPVSAAVSTSCSTTSVKALSEQLVAEIQCMRPGTLKSIEGVPGFSLGSAVFPFLQTPAANALISARGARGGTMTINSALRTLPQQYLLYRWYQTGRCGIGLAAAPGRSNHESAVAVDIADNTGWRSSMGGKNFRWLGSSDPVHFDFTGAGLVDLRGLSVKAFQRLWNRNNPGDTITEDGDYGAKTEARLAKAPVGGFAKGASCASVQTDPPEPAAPLSDVPVVIDANEPEREPEPRAPELAPSAPEPREPSAPAAGGCATSARSSTSGALTTGALGLLAVFVVRRRARRAHRARGNRLARG